MSAERKFRDELRGIKGRFSKWCREGQLPRFKVGRCSKQLREGR
jgi:hypothetical protein